MGFLPISFKLSVFWIKLSVFFIILPKHQVIIVIVSDSRTDFLRVFQVWMLTGDKLETATCIAKSSRLVSRTQDLYIFAPVATRTEAHQQLNTFRKKQDCALVITGDSLEVIIGFVTL